MLGLDDTTVKKSDNKMASTLQPPPGFESESSNGHVRLEDFTDDFVEVGAVIVEGELPEAPSPLPQDKPKIIEETIAQKEPKFASKKSDFPATYFDQNGGYSSRKSHYFEEEPAEIKTVHNQPQETLIEREIRLQKEREEALALEREMALKNLRNAPHSTKSVEQKSVEPPMEPAIVKKTQEVVVPEPKVPEKKILEQAATNHLSPAEARISEEIRELKKREEELRIQREKLLANHVEETDNPASIPTIDEGHYSDAEGQSDRDFQSEANSSRVATPEVSSLEYSKFPHQRTQSLDSMSSGHSSGDHAIHAAETAAVTPNNTKTKRQVIVKPFDEPDDEESTPAYRRVLKETPIEREIRLAREREEALRREKGIPTWATAVSSKGTERENRLVSRLNSVDKRDVQHRLATSRIQLEIEETVEREKELLSAGTIQTTSEDRVDDKVTRLGQMEAFAETEVVKERRPLAKSVSTPSLFQDQPIAEAPKADRIEEEPIPKPKPITRALSTTTTGPVTPAVTVPVRKFSNPAGPQRGLMEKFLASRGRMMSQPAFTTASKTQGQDVATPRSTPGDLGNVVTLPATRNVPVPPLNSAAVQSLVVMNKDEKIPEESKPVLRNPPPRRTYATAEEKIQAELREMQKREEELRANRMKLFAKSQPNLLAAIDAEETQDFSSFKAKGSQLKAAVSIPDLLDAEDNPSETNLPTSRAQSKGMRRKNALIAQWENMIQQTNQ